MPHLNHVLPFTTRDGRCRLSTGTSSRPWIQETTLEGEPPRPLVPEFE